MEKELGRSPDIDLLLSIVNEIEKAFQVHFTKGEIGYLLLQISGEKNNYYKKYIWKYCDQ